MLASLDLMTQVIDESILSNLTPDQIEIAREQLGKSKSGSKPKPVITESTEKIPTIDINKSKDAKYGYSYFSSVPTSVSAVGDLPLPNDYKISLKDQFTVVLSGSKDEIFDLDVNLDGTILFPELGSISVVGDTFGEVKVRLKNLIEQAYIGTQIDISLKNLSAKKITITGAVKTPGTYLVNPFSTISSALAYSGGISEIGTLRNIRLVRNNGKTFYFDLYELLIDGDRSKDITIESGDVIIIDPADQFILLSGQVKRPAIYEINKGENLDDLIKFGLGFTRIANTSNIELSTLDIATSSIKKVVVNNSLSSLNNVLSVNVNEYISKIIPNVGVYGAIKEPGLYEITENENLDELIKRINFVDVYPWLAVLEQFDEKNLVKSTFLFSLRDPSTYETIRVLPNSRLFFANLDERSFDVSPMSNGLIKDYELTINHNQGTFNLPVFGRFSVSSLVNFLGLDMKYVDQYATYLSPLDDLVKVEKYEDMKFVAKKFNTVSFRSPVNDLIKVTISGAIDYPGTYVMEPNSSLQDLYDLVGNFKPEAFLNGIIFSKESIRNNQLEAIEKSKDDLKNALLLQSQEGDEITDINVIQALSASVEPANLGRVAGNFSPQSISSGRTILSDGDAVIVPKNPNTISVLGEVLNPIAFEFEENVSVRIAISNAGGFEEYADKERIYVIKANGRIQRVPRNIFTRNLDLEQGDTVIVPRKIITTNPALKALLPVTQILSDIAFSAAAIENLSNN